MRRIALILVSLLAAAGSVVAVAGADDNKTYEAELFNAFGLVEGSELRVAGVKAGTVTGLDVTAEKTALITFEVGPEFPELKADASCSSEPQSLIAEYFLNCQPGSSDQPLEGPIEAARNQTTVQNDLVQNTLREPFKRRFQLILNEFGTALVGNAENLNAAIRSGAPALRELSEVLKILGRQNTIIAQLNSDSDAVFQELTNNREDVVRFIDEAEDTARISAERREDLATDFDLLDDFLFELKPVMHELGNLAREQTPLLTDLRAAAPGLNRLATNLPGFNQATEVSLESLGNASAVGQRALAKSTDEIDELNTAAQKAPPAADVVADFLENLDDPANAVEEDCDARYDLREQPGEADRRVGILEQKLGTNLTGRHDIPTSTTDPQGCNLDPGSPTGNPGYTGLEGLLNYAYVQPAALNLFDAAGHALQIHIVGASDLSEGAGRCGHYSGGADWPKRENLGGGSTNDPKEAAYCVSILGDYQPGVSAGTVDASGRTDFDGPGGSPPLGKYSPQVCPDGSTRQAICDPTDPPFGYLSAGEASAPEAVEVPSVEEAQDALDGLEKPLKDLDDLRKKLGLPPGTPLPTEVTDAVGLTSPQGATPQSAQQQSAGDLLNFLFGP
jgi:ABC-type transporter Mla subunit MlaD